MPEIKPLKLSIKGLNSFIEEQTIDFDLLTERGLFGIFGPTGSGKSSILDAIILALYGRVPRSNAHLSGIVNTQSDRIRVYYKFAIGQGEDRRTYSVERILKRNKNDGSRTSEAIICDISNPGDIQVIRQGQREVNAGIEEIIGLNADDFTRSVVLPQGNFSEFLRLKGNERRNMLERIFSLEKYGEEMMRRIALYKSKKREEKNLLEGALALYGDVSQEAAAFIEEELSAIQENRQELSQNLLLIEKDYEKYQNIWQWQEELAGYRQEAAELEARQEEFAGREKTLEMAQKAVFLKPLINEIRVMEKSLLGKRQELKEVESTLAELSSSLTQTSRSWQEVSEKKNSELPQLREKCKGLYRAMEIKRQLTELEKERLQLRTEYKDLTAQINEKNKIHIEIQEKMKKQQDELAGKTERISSLKLAPEERELINKAYEKEKEYRSLDKRYGDISGRIASLAEKVEKAGEATAATEKSIKIMDEDYRQLVNRRKSLDNKCPADSERLLSIQKEISFLQSEIKELRQWMEKRQENEEAMGEAEKARQKLQEKLLKEKEEFEQQEEACKELKKRLEKSREKNMALLLARKLEEGQTCPVCGSLHHPVLPDYTDIEEIASLEKELQKQEKTQQKRKLTLDNLEMDYRGLLKEIEDKSSAIAILQEKIGERNLQALEKDCQERDKGFTQLQRDLADWEKSIRECDIEIANTREKLAGLRNREAGEKKAWETDKSYLKDMQKEAVRREQELQGSREEFDGYRALLGMDSIEKRYQELVKNDRKIGLLEKEEKDLRALMEQMDKDSSRLQEAIQHLAIEKERIRERGEGKKAVIEVREAELQALNPEEDPQTALELLKQAMADIEESYIKIGEKYSIETKQSEELKEEHAKLSWTIDDLGKRLTDEEEEMDKHLRESTFASMEEVLAAFRSDDEIKDLQESIADYRRRLMINKENIKRLVRKLAGEVIQEEEWQLLLDKRRRMQEELEGINRELLLKSEQKKNMEKRLQELKDLEVKKKGLDQDYDLLLEMENLFRGKKFVEYIAKNRLAYIAREASQKLKDITRGRYALELNDEGEFIMRDDFNGGARRPTHTLSGGETFLTSLSLALALSSNIQLGKASLEFFFLDEGFGSLDAEILDIVMASLERLQSERLSVGIISHVEELKQRIPRRLLVKAAIPGESGSRVEIEEN